MLNMRLHKDQSEIDERRKNKTGIVLTTKVGKHGKFLEPGDPELETPSTPEKKSDRQQLLNGK